MDSAATAQTCFYTGRLFSASVKTRRLNTSLAATDTFNIRQFQVASVVLSLESVCHSSNTVNGYNYIHNKKLFSRSNEVLWLMPILAVF